MSLTRITYPDELSDLRDAVRKKSGITEIELVPGEPRPFLLSSLSTHLLNKQHEIDAVASASRLTRVFVRGLKAMQSNRERLIKQLLQKAQSDVPEVDDEDDTPVNIWKAIEDTVEGVDQQAVEDYATLLYAGFALFDDDLSYEEVLLYTTPASIARTVKEVFSVATDYAEGAPDLSPATWGDEDDEDDEDDKKKS